MADFVGNMENVPSEIRHLFSEISDLDDQYEEHLSKAQQHEHQLQKTYKLKQNRDTATPQESDLLTQLDKDHQAAQLLSQEKIRLTKKAIGIVQRHLTKLESEIRHFDKSSGGGHTISVMDGRHRDSIDGIETPRGGRPSTPSVLGTVGIRDGELDGFRVPTPSTAKRLTDSLMAFEDESDAFYTPTRGPKRNRQRPNGQRQKKHLKLNNPSILSMDGVEVDPANPSAVGMEESDDQPYCFCRQVSYGDMVACDGPDCRHEWFHWECVGLTSPPKGSWYCSECLAKLLEDDNE